MRQAVSILCSIMLLPSVACAQFDRSGDWEAGAHVANYASLSLSGFRGASMDVENGLGYGFSGAYNFSDHFALGMDAAWRSADYRATFVPDGPGSNRVLNASMDVSRIHFRGTYYFLESRLTPFIEGSYGWTQIDSNIQDGPAFTGCWWDPWWGYVCQTTYQTYTETRSSYGAALGIRWDSRSDIVLRGSIGALKIDRGHGVDGSSVDVTQFEVLWRF